MNFSSLSFWINLALLLACVFGIRGALLLFKHKALGKFDGLLLALVSSALLFSESPITFCVFVYVLLVSWIASKCILHSAVQLHGKKVLAGFIFLQLLPLLYFKYYGFAVEVFGGDHSYYEGYIIPVGISFYTFQLIGYVIDLNKKRGTSASFLEEYNFACFFPQIVAGPIERKENLLPQIKMFSFKISNENCTVGVRMMIAGLFYKLVLGDNLGQVSQWCVNPTNNPFAVWMGSFLFGLRIYFDFSGYSMVAVGLGRLFGIKLTQNFKSPYTAVDIQQFWGRWHRTLSTWFRDYLYIPMGGSRVKWWWVNVLVVFVVSGIWHGAGWNFVIWGFFHGAMLVLYKSVGSKLPLPSFFKWALTMVFVTLSWLFFYETDSSQLMDKVVVLGSTKLYSLSNLAGLPKLFGTGLDFLGAMIMVGVALAIVFIEYIGIKRSDDPYWLWEKPLVPVIAVVFIYLCPPATMSGFIYFNF